MTDVGKDAPGDNAKANATTSPDDANSQDDGISEVSQALSETSKSDYVRAIMDPADTTFSRLVCHGMIHEPTETRKR